MTLCTLSTQDGVVFSRLRIVGVGETVGDRCSFRERDKSATEQESPLIYLLIYFYCASNNRERRVTKTLARSKHSKAKMALTADL